MPDARPWTHTLLRVALFSLASNIAVLFVLKFGQIMWPGGLPSHSQNVFWLASGVNVAGLLLLGLRWWPVILLNAFPAWLIAGEQLDITIPASLANALEALLAAWMVRRFGKFAGCLDSSRAVGALLIASLMAPLCNTLIIPAWFCMRGVMNWSALPQALGQWNLSNGAAMLMVAPLLMTILHGAWTARGRWRELAVFFAATVAVSIVAFDALFVGSNFNITFLVFPAVIYAAARFGMGEVSAVLGIILTIIFGLLATHAQAIPGPQMASAIWFAQAFCWVLSASGLLVAALVREREMARNAIDAERARSLEISLREEHARLETLRYQLSPHFLFNSLNSIYSTLPAAGAEVSRKMITQLSGYLRSTLAGHERDMLPLREELRSMEQYLAIERNRFGDVLRVKILADDAAMDVEVPAFLLQPLVENAILHGFTATQGAFRLEIRTALEKSKLRIEIANTGTWKAGRGDGVGLSNTRRRLELLFGGDASLQMENTDGWVRIKIALPIADDETRSTNLEGPTDALPDPR